jgi:exodeoxyribonuclease VII small subunit
MPKEKQSFEKSLERLETIVSKLEKGDAALDESIELYQEGITLARFCSKKLEEAKGKIEIVLKDGGKVKKKDFDASNLSENGNDDQSKSNEELF